MEPEVSLQWTAHHWSLPWVKCVPKNQTKSLWNIS